MARRPKDRRQGGAGYLAQLWASAVASPAKYGALAVLVIQNSALVLLMRLSRTRALASGEEQRYLATTAVVCMELLKLVSSLGILVYTQGSVRRVWALVYREIILDAGSTLVMAVPSLLYVLQNNLLYVAVANLEPGTYQVTYQLKILTTVMFSVAMFGTRITLTKAVSLGLLIVGVALVQTAALPAETSSSGGSGSSGGESAGDGLAAVTVQNPLLGLFTVLCACFTSGFAGVYFEKILKGRGKRSATPWSIWIKNIQFALFGVGMGLVAVATRDGAAVLEHGFFQGYNATVWGVVFFQGLGGLTVAVIIKYADSIVKGYAASVSIVTSTALANYLFGNVPSPQFVVGAGLVIVAVYLYSLPQALPPVPSTQRTDV